MFFIRSTHLRNHLLVSKAYRLKLYPTAEQRSAFMRWSGSCRWVWNHFLALKKAEYERCRKFIFRYDLDKMLPSLKAEHDWLKEAPACSLQRIARNLDTALKRSFKAGAGFPRFKNCFGRRSFYLTNQDVRFLDGNLVLSKIRRVRFRADRLPEGKILGATVALEGDDWFCTIQCQVELADAVVSPALETVIGLDAGLQTLAVMSDGVSIVIPKTERCKAGRVRRLQKELSRRQRGSANREKTRRRLAKAHADLANVRRDCRHKLTRELVDRASAIVIEDLNVKAMSRGLRFGKSVGLAGMGEMRRQIEYKAQWTGKTVVVADRYFPSSQACSCCGEVKSGAQRLQLHHRTYRCDCGNVMERDLNAAMNLRRYGLNVLGLDPFSELEPTPGQAMPRAPDLPEIACGDSSAGPMTSVSGRYGSMMQESLDDCGGKTTIRYE